MTIKSFISNLWGLLRFLFFCAEPVACGRLFVPDLTFGEHIGMDEHIFFYMGETQERCVFCWLDAPVSK